MFRFAGLALLGMLAINAAPSPKAEEGRVLADALATRLELSFVFEQQGEAYARALREKAAAGGYDGIADRETLARTMTADLQTVAKDGHLKVIADPGAPPPPRPDGQRRHPDAVEQAGWIAPGIAYIRFNAFPHEEAATKATAEFMASHTDAKAIIFDCRTHRGGGLDQMDVIFPYLFTRPTKLVTMATRRSVEEQHGAIVTNRPTLKLIDAGPDVVARDHWALPGKATPLAKARVYVLTGPRTASAAEHFTLAMKGTKRGTIIGMPTAGANHFGGVDDLPGRYGVFMPVGRTYDPQTGKDWETDGIAPDVAVPTEQALVEALTREGIARPEAERLSAEYKPTQPMERLKRY